MPTVIDLTGQEFGRLLVISRSEEKSRRGRWLCLCDCLNLCLVDSIHLRKGRTRSCGCLCKETSRALLLTHGLSKMREFRIWLGIKNRCYNPENSSYSDYGGRGIKVCDRWLNSFPNFLTDLGRRPSDKHSVGRLDNDGNYEPNNCRWETIDQQANNRRKPSRYRVKYEQVMSQIKEELMYEMQPA